MKRLGILLLTSAVALLPLTLAKAESILLNGQKQYYTVQLRSDKQAIVYARIIFENASSETNLSTYEFSLPSGVNIDNLAARQILAKPSKSTCVAYETLEEWRTRNAASPTTTTYDTSKKCLSWGTAAYDDDFDYAADAADSTDYYYYSYYQESSPNFEYVDLKQSGTNGTYTITLSEAVKPKKQASILVTFTTNDFVSSGFLGRYTYNVRTLLAKQMIDKTVVAVNFDNDMYTRKAAQKRTYDTTTTSSMDSLGAGTANSAYESKSMDSFISSIGQGGVYVRSQSSLLPGDMLSVTGVFATNRAMLFVTEILVGILLLVLLLIGIGFYRIWRKGHPGRPTPSEKTQTIPVSDGARPIATLLVTVSWKRIVLTSLAATIGTILIVLGLGSVILSGTDSSTTGWLLILGFGVVGLIGGIIAPLMYMLRFGAENAFRWTLVHIAIISTLLLAFGALSGLNNPSYEDPSGPQYYMDDTI